MTTVASTVNLGEWLFLFHSPTPRIRLKMIIPNTRKNIKKKIKKWNKLYLEGKLNLHKVKLEWNSWNNHASHASSFNLRNRMYEKIILKELLKNPKDELLTKKG